jgi:hypothetical protein
MLFNLDFVFVGPQRTGTSWIDQVLRTHPKLCLPKDVKETMFFDRHYKKGISYYASYFNKGKKGQIFGELAPTYFDDPLVPVRIRKLNPYCKIFISIREPISRVLSLYIHNLKKGYIKGSLMEAVRQLPRLLDSGKYSNIIPVWLNTFGTDQVFFILFDEIENKPGLVLNNICKYLNIEKISMPETCNRKINQTTFPRYPSLARLVAPIIIFLHDHRLHHIVEIGKNIGLNKIYTGSKKKPVKFSTEEIKYVLDYYFDDILFLENLLNIDLSEWREINGESDYSN